MPDCARCVIETPADVKLDGTPLCWPCVKKVIEAGIGPAAVVAEPLNWQPREVSAHA